MTGEDMPGADLNGTERIIQVTGHRREPWMRAAARAVVLDTERTVSRLVDDARGINRVFCKPPLPVHVVDAIVSAVWLEANDG